MYATCLYCTAPLGANEVIETLPIGRRLAFDAAAGRLWVVCVACARWNLVPFDRRLEAIDEGERRFRDCRTRFSTENIGLARLSEGLELIRIGPALKPEFAAWRYGRRLARRRLRVAGFGQEDGGWAGRLLSAVGAINRVLALPLVDSAVPVGVALAEHRLVRDPWTDRLVRVPVAAMVRATMVVDDDLAWYLDLPYRTEVESLLGTDPLQLLSMRDHPVTGFFRGGDLLPALGRTLPVLERRRPTAELLREAVRLLEVTRGEPERLLPYLSGRPMRFETRRRFPLAEVPPELRLALEMAAHEQTERSWLDGELRLLEREWREADRLARIADDLALDGAADGGVRLDPPRALRRAD